MYLEHTLSATLLDIHNVLFVSLLHYVYNLSLKHTNYKMYSKVSLLNQRTDHPIVMLYKGGKYW